MSRAVAVGLFKEASANMAQGKLTVAARLAGRAREVFLTAGDVDGACAAASLEGRIEARAGRLQIARDSFAWAVEEAERRGLEARALSALTELGTLAELTGDLQAAVAIHRQVLERQRKRQDEQGVAVAAGNVGRLLPRLAPGRSDAESAQAEARALLDEARQRFEAAGNAAGAANAWMCLADLERSAGRLQAAAQAFEAVAQTTEQAGLHALAAVAHLNLGHVRRDRGDLDGALTAYQTSRDLALRLGDRLSVARADQALAMAKADIDAPEVTEQAFARVEAEFRAIGQPAGALSAAVNRAAVLCRRGRLVQGADLLDKARVELQAGGERLGAVEVTLALAEVRMAQGLPAEAVTLLAGLPAVAHQGRLGIRQALLRARLAVVALDLIEADRQLALLPAEVSASEAFSAKLITCELGTLRGDRAVADQLVALQAELAGPGTRREAAAVLTARAHDAFWRGDLTSAELLAGEVQAAWRALGEPLPGWQVQALLWRIAVLQGGRPDPVQLEAQRQAVEAAGARDAAVLLDILAASVAVRDGSAEAGILPATLARLESSGHVTAATTSALFVAKVCALTELGAEAAGLLQQAGGVLPAWWNAATSP